MLTIYLTGTLVGGVLVMLSALGLGSDAEAQLEADADVGVDADVELDGDLDADLGLDAWLPVASLRFWTFFFAFGGLAGALLTWQDVLTAPGVGVAAGLTGWACGVAISHAVRRLRRERVGRSIERDDFVGTIGNVLLPIPTGGIGKVRIEIAGRIVDVPATTDDPDELPTAHSVLVYAVRDDGTAVVTTSAAP